MIGWLLGAGAIVMTGVLVWAMSPDPSGLVAVSRLQRMKPGSLVNSVGKWTRLDGVVARAESMMKSSITGRPCVGYQVVPQYGERVRASDVGMLDFVMKVDGNEVAVRASAAPEVALMNPAVGAREALLQVGDVVSVAGLLVEHAGGYRGGEVSLSLEPHPKTGACFVAHTELLKG